MSILDMTVPFVPEEQSMAAHTDHHTPEPASGAGLLPIFAIAGIVALLSRLIGPEDH
jgi:hypothetical protein